MNVIDFPCPSCGWVLKVSSDLNGRSGMCNHCGGRIVVNIPAKGDADIAEQMRALESLAVSPKSVDELIQAVSDFLVTHMECSLLSKTVFFLMDAQARGLRLTKTSGQFSQEFLKEEAFVPLGKCLCGRAAQSGEVLVCEDCFDDPRHDSRWLGMDAHGHYVIPFVHGGQVLGVLTLYTRSGVKVDPHRMLLLAKISEYAGKGLHQLLANG